MEPQPGPSFLFKREINQARLSLIENEEEPSRDELKLPIKKEVQTHPSTSQNGDIIAYGHEHIIYPPPSTLPDEPWKPWNPILCVWNIFVYLFLTTFFFIFSPILLLIYLFLGALPRILVKLVLKCFYGRKIQLLPISRVFGSAFGNHHTVMVICRGRCDIERIRDHMTAIISATDPVTGNSKFGHLIQRVRTQFGYVCMEDRGSRFDIKNHVKHFDIRSKNLTVDVDDIIPYLESTYEEPFENSLTQPQWEILVIPKYSHRPADSVLLTDSDKQRRLYALIFRFHNGIMDWNMFQMLLVEYIGRTGGRVKSIFCRAPLNRNNRILTAWTKIRIYLSVPFVGPYYFMKQVCTKWSRFAGMKKQCPEKISFAMTKPIDCETIEDIKDRTYTSIDSVLTSCARMSIRNMVLGQNMDFPKALKTVRVFNSISKSLPDVDYQRSNYKKYRLPLERLHSSFHVAEKHLITNAGVRIFNKGMMLFAGVFSETMSSWIYRNLMKADLVLEVFPGADEPCKVFGGDMVADMYGWSGITGMDADFKITITTYCGRVRANITGKLGLLSGVHSDAFAIAREFEEEFRTLASTAGVYPNRLFLAPAVDESSGMFV